MKISIIKCNVQLHFLFNLLIFVFIFSFKRDFVAQQHVNNMADNYLNKLASARFANV